MVRVIITNRKNALSLNHKEYTNKSDVIGVIDPRFQSYWHTVWIADENGSKMKVKLLRDSGHCIFYSHVKIFAMRISGYWWTSLNPWNWWSLDYCWFGWYNFNLKVWFWKESGWIDWYSPWFFFWRTYQEWSWSTARSWIFWGILIHGSNMRTSRSVKHHPLTSSVPNYVIDDKLLCMFIDTN